MVNLNQLDLTEARLKTRGQSPALQNFISAWWVCLTFSPITAAQTPQPGQVRRVLALLFGLSRMLGLDPTIDL